VSRDGFAVADVDVGFMHDRKVVALSRLLNDDALCAVAVVMYQAVVLASWEAGERVAIEDAQPAWLRVSLGGVRSSLEAVALIDAEGRVPEATWEGWFGPARDRRSLRRAQGRAGGLASARARGEANAQPNGSPNAEPVARRIGSDRLSTTTTNENEATSSRAPAREEGRPDLEAFLSVRYRPPTPAQRTLIDAYCEVFDLTGPQRAADLIYRHPDDPIGALKADLAAFREQRRTEAIAAEAKPKQPPRRAAAPTGIRAELAKIWAQQEAEKAQG
jgi:hypothetical protein